MRYRLLDIHRVLFLHMLEEGEKHYKVVKNPLPAGVKFIRAGHDFIGRLILVLEHESFDEVKEGDEIPYHPQIEMEKL